MSTQKILKVGNSLGVTLPSEVVKTLSIKPGDQVEVIKESGNTITIEFINSHQLSLGLPTTKHHSSKNI